MNKIRIAVLFGGISGEHEVSCWSAVSILSHLNPEKYDVTPIGITKDGRWFLQAPWDGRKLAVSEPGRGAVSVVPGVGLSANGVTLPLDVVFPIAHGIQGEDGKLQGLLECTGLSYAGAKVLASAVGMDKAITKKLWEREGLPVVPWLVFRAEQLVDVTNAYEQSVAKLGLPLFIKPANSGSSVGVAKVTAADQFEPAVRAALKVDAKVMVEAAVDAREIEVALMGSSSPRAYGPGEVVPTHEFYDYDAKYIDPDGADLVIPPNLPPEVIRRILELAKQAYQTLDTEGFARVDFFVARSGEGIWINEINTLPGFTTISMFPRMAMAGGMTYAEVLDDIVDQALETPSK
jgi:D-alanine-D-alanine ligase